MAKKRNPAEETDSDLLIDMQDIVKTFNIGTPNELTILHGVNFNLARGEFLSVVGTSGSGKSTLMNIIGLLDKPTAPIISMVSTSWSFPTIRPPSTVPNTLVSCSRTST